MTATPQELIPRLQDAMHNESASHSPRTTLAIEAMRAAQTYIDAAAKREAAMQSMIDKAVGEERERCAQVCDAVSLAAHLATGLAGDDEIKTRVGAASYARAAEHIAAAIRKGAKP